jgi:hypothetical protein
VDLYSTRLGAVNPAAPHHVEQPMLIPAAHVSFAARIQLYRTLIYPEVFHVE